MFRNHLLIAIRNIRRNKFYSLISISCLAIGIAACMTIMLYCLHEYSFDRFHTHAKRIFAVTVHVKYDGSDYQTPGTSAATGPMIQQANGNVEGYVRTIKFYKAPVKDPLSSAGNLPDNKPFLCADSNFFNFFSFRLLRGTASQVLLRPDAVVLTERAARKYFGDRDPVGRTLLLYDSIPLEVTGVSADPPSNSSIDYDFVAAFPVVFRASMGSEIARESTVMTGWTSTWLLLRDPDQVKHVESTLHQLALLAGSTHTDSFPMIALPALHLDKKMGYGRFDNRYLKIFPLVGVLSLLLALVNYMSLATARGSTRAKEVGVRKTMGAGRSGIAAQFYTESALSALLSFGAGTIGFLLLRPWLCGVLQLEIDVSFMTTPLMLCAFAGLLVLVIAGAGSYPALVLSSFNPVAVLYGRIAARQGGARIRKGFTVFQFAVSAALVLCSFIIVRQLDYIRYSDTGVDRENVLLIRYYYNFKHQAALKRDLEALPAVRDASTALNKLYSGVGGWAVPSYNQRPGFSLSVLNADEHFISFLNLKWKYPPLDSQSFSGGKPMFLNEAAMQMLGLSGNPVGTAVVLNPREPARIVSGVLKDFNFASLHEKVGPFGLFVVKDSASFWEFGGTIYLKLRAHINLPATIAAMKNIYDKYDASNPFDYQFLDEDFNQLYKAEDRLAALMSMFTAVTILIACMGLFALATFSAQQRTKEIGIRKVLGASVSGIVSLLSGDFLQPVLLALVIAAPLAWWAMHRWLEGFAYRTSISWWIFPLMAGLVLLLALGTVFFQSLRAARANPANNLRVE